MPSVQLAGGKWHALSCLRLKASLRVKGTLCLFLHFSSMLPSSVLAADPHDIYLPRNPDFSGVDMWGTRASVHDLDAGLVLIRTTTSEAALRSGTRWFFCSENSLIALPDALAHYERAASREPQTPGWLRLQALATAESGDPLGALRILGQLPESESRSPAVDRLRAQLCMTIGSYLPALAACNDAIEVQPKNSDLYFLRNKVLLAIGDTDGANADRKVAFRLPSAIGEQSLKTAIDGFRSGASSIEGLLAALHDREVRAPLSRGSFDLFRVAALTQASRHKDAANWLMQLLASDPTNQLALLQLSIIRGKHFDDPLGALAACERALAVEWSPADGFFGSPVRWNGPVGEVRGFPWMIATAAHLQAAQLLLEMGRFQEAIDHADQALRVEPTLPFALAHAGWCRWVRTMNGMHQGVSNAEIEGYFTRANDQSHWRDTELIDLLGVWYVTTSNMQGLENMQQRLAHSFPNGSEVRTRIDRIAADLGIKTAPIRPENENR